MLRGVFLPWLVGFFCFLTGRSAVGGTWAALTELRQGSRAEWRLEGLPATANPFDPDAMAVDASFREPDGSMRRVPAFWYRPHRRELRAGVEAVTVTGPGEWRLRYYPFSAGEHEVVVTVRERGGEPSEWLRERFTTAAAPGPVRGMVQVAPDRQFFETRTPSGARAPLALVGADVCWHGARGTYDYDDWFPAMAASGWTWARLWMWPTAFGLEAGAGDRLNYRQDRAWQLDHVFQLAEKHGLRLLLCLDYHGMFETEPDYWGGNNYWTRHPYHVANGGPCASQREFFTNPEARDLYRKRLRYLVARYGASPALHAWQFFNEIDNVYRHLNAAEVAAWHGDQGEWLKANDPWNHLVTTSLTSQSNRPEIWELPAMDFAVYHSYSESGPARRLSQVIASMRSRYGKPVLVGEAGVDWRGWSRASDPFLRGFRQLVWGGVTSGSAGTSMSWWWEAIHSENAYPYYRALTNVLEGSGWSKGRWDALTFEEAGPAPAEVGPRVEGGSPFTVTLTLDGSWGAMPSGRLAVPDALAAGDAPKRLNSFVHGSAHPDLRVPFRLDAWFGEGARLIAHLNSVSQGAIFSVRANGVERFRRSLPNKDGGFAVNNEYNEDLVVELPAGRLEVEIRNVGGDWFHLDWVRLEKVLPAEYANGWRPLPSATGIRQETEMLLHVIAPGFEYPAGATVTNPPPLKGALLHVLGVPPGDYAVVWFQTTDGAEVGRGSGHAGENGRLSLPLPDFADELVGHVFGGPRLRVERADGTGNFAFRVDGVRPGDFQVERASDPAGGWLPWGTSAGGSGGAGFGGVVQVPMEGRDREFFRVRWAE